MADFPGQSSWDRLRCSRRFLHRSILGITTLDRQRQVCGAVVGSVTVCACLLSRGMNLDRQLQWSSRDNLQHYLRSQHGLSQNKLSGIIHVTDYTPLDLELLLRLLLLLLRLLLLEVRCMGLQHHGCRVLAVLHRISVHL